jgi:hypothetical protein
MTQYRHWRVMVMITVVSDDVMMMRAKVSETGWM